MGLFNSVSNLNAKFFSAFYKSNKVKQGRDSRAKSTLPYLALLFALLSPKLMAACNPSFSLPIDLNQYYSSINIQQGEALKAQLKNIIDGQNNLGYSCVWDILRSADEDPSNNNYVIGFYTRRSILKTDRDYGQNTPDAWNREHMWAKSHGIGSSDKSAYSDAHHLRATDKSVNADRASKDFAEGGSQHWECSGCRTTATTWEPPDEVKGDTARIMFYMATRYEGSDSGGDLELLDNTGTSSPYHGKLCTLMNWHLQDPADLSEQRRNEVVYSYQGNRNPFIDHPEYAVSIWGETCGIEAPVGVERDEDIPFLPWWALGALAGLSLLQFYRQRR